MIVKLHKSEVMEQSYPDRLGLELHQRDSSADSLSEFVEF
jgi:hypothetical protein